ncbi:type IV conjugative transfer system protein TraL [Vibrio breoganii]|uniref:type IV conjugative transfer system protein TraL n=1 Tax=Vibrio breoganii TaxID=553239 RepID=UPI000C83E2F2|nr:type IV conjugative transfer system protein TraL [Vibrio breoganii]PMN67137.1 type IV conjugative transfer system protein TraL [Vibrio breoganii]PMO82886.1 type IV conjugative transfer system protein TraL [Vibrio breoganii]TKF90431.1 type IV conjugative transfer system protein TraL [Vibrio breoganii]
MLNEDKTIDMPDLVDEPIHFLIWQFDEIAAVAIGLVVGIVINSPVIGLVLGICAKTQYCKIRDGKPRGYFIHRLRDLGFPIDHVSERSSMQPPLVDEFHS